jgi:phage terminase small subunit
MGRPRLSDEEKRRRHTFQPSRGEASLVHGRNRLSEPVPAPAELDEDARREWDLHMALLTQAGTISRSNLRALLTLAKVAAANERAYREAMKSGVLLRTKNGVRTNPAWDAFSNTAALYLRWCDKFGLVPMSARNLPQLPPARGVALHEVV